MRIVDGALSLLVRGALLWFVLSASTSVTGKDRRVHQVRSQSVLKSDELALGLQPSFSRASIGFVASLAVMVLLMIALGATASVTVPAHPLMALRGTI